MTDLETQRKGTNDRELSADGLSHSSKEQLVVDRKAERRLVWKLDRVIIPVCILLYLAAYLDRGNLGNARLQGLEADVLDGSSVKYSIALSCFFITYAILSIPSTLLIKRFSPAKVIAVGAAIWSIAASCQAAAFNPAGLYVCRLFVGVGESFFATSVTVYFSYWYTKGQLSKRLGIYVSAGALAGAFGGLISFGVSSITSALIAQWRILFLIEGLPSLVLACVVFFCLPTRPQTSTYINEDERKLVLAWLERDNLGETGNRIDPKAIRRALLDWKTYVVAVSYSCMNLGLGSVSGFLPTIIKQLGYTNAQANLYTVPPYAVALAFMIIITSISDRLCTRGVPIICVFVIGIVGWALLLGVSPIDPSFGALRARYFACFCVVTAGYSSIPLLLALTADNSGSHTQRAVALGMLNLVGQGFAILAAFLFPSAEGPKYTKGASVNLAFQCFGLLLMVGVTTCLRLENRARDRREGGRPEPGAFVNVVHEYDLAPGFRYTP